MVKKLRIFRQIYFERGINVIENNYAFSNELISYEVSNEYPPCREIWCTPLQFRNEGKFFNRPTDSRFMVSVSNITTQ